MIKETKKAPTIRFRDFTDDWEQRKLEDFGRATGGTSIESEFNKEGKYKVISIGSYSENSTYTDQGIRCNLTEKTQNRILNKNDLTMILNDKTAVGRIIGRVLLIEQDNSYVYNQRTERIEPNKNKYDPLFLYEMLNAPGIRSKIVRQCQGNTQIYVNWPVIANQKYKIPELKEQKIIGFFLKDLDHLITLHQRKLDQLKTLKKYFLQNMFPAKGEKVPRIRFKGFTGDWEQRKLGDLGKARSGIGFPNDEQGGKDGIPFYKVSDMNNAGNEHEMITANNYVTREQIARKGWSVIEEVPAIFFAKVGAAVLLNRKRLCRFPFLLDNNTMAYSIDRSVLNTDFAKTLFETIDLTALIQVGALPSYNAGDVENVNVVIPRMAEQKKIGANFKKLDNLITLHQCKIDQLQTMKKFMLQNLFI